MNAVQFVAVLVLACLASFALGAYAHDTAPILVLSDGGLR